MGQAVIREGGEVILEHYPVIPTELANMADVGGASSHDGLGDLSPSHKNIIACAQPN